MRRSALHALVLALSLAMGTLCAQPSASPHTGDAWIDERLVDIGRYAGTYRDAFIDELARYHRAPRDFVRAVLARPGWTPGDVYFACALATQLGRPCRDVVAERDRTPGEDWAAVAARLGVRPGTPAFRALKDGVLASYGRWGRPVVEDVAPAPDGRGHASAPKSPTAR